MNPVPTPSITVAPSSVTPTVDLNSTTPEDDSGLNTQPKNVSSLDTVGVNGSVALASRETLFFMILAGVIASSLIF